VADLGSFRQDIAEAEQSQEQFADQQQVTLTGVQSAADAVAINVQTQDRTTRARIQDLKEYGFREIRSVLQAIDQNEVIFDLWEDVLLLRIERLQEAFRQATAEEEAQIRASITTAIQELEEYRQEAQTQLRMQEQLLREQEMRVKMFVSNSMTAMRGVLDLYTLSATLLGKQVDVQFSAMISLAMSSIQQAVMLATLHSTAGNWATASAILGTIPLFTSAISMYNQAQEQSQMRVDEALQQIKEF